MAKGSMMLSKMRGKMGGMVFRVDHDAGQVVSEYNGSPKNPRTPAQVGQRSKMNLAGQISKLTPYMAIAGLDTSKRRARSKFVSNLLKQTTLTAPAGSGYSSAAQVEYGNVSFSNGVDALSNLTGSVAQQTRVVTATATPATGMGTIVAVRFVHIIAVDGKVVAVVVSDVDTPTAGGDFVNNITLPGGDAGTIADNVYAIPIVETDGSVGVAYQQGVISGGRSAHEEMSAAVAVTISTLGGFGRSVYGGQIFWEDE